MNHETVAHCTSHGCIPKTTKQTEAMKLALGKIKSARDCHPNAVATLLFEAEESLEEALAEQPAPVQPAEWADAHGNYQGRGVISNAARPAPVQQEPVAVEHCLWARNGNTPCPHTSPPPQRTWVGLTNEDKREIVNNNSSPLGGMLDAEAKLKEKNT